MKDLRETCPMFGEKCEHCSRVIIRRPYTKIRFNKDFKLYEPFGIGHTKADIGAFCNNHPIGETGMVDEMTVCPSRWGLASGYRKESLVRPNGMVEVKKRGRPKGLK